jgi:chromosomal replication initiation ATPase DnaA
MLPSQRQKLETALRLLTEVLESEVKSLASLQFDQETNVERVLKTVAAAYELPYKDLFHKSRATHYSWPRFVAAYLLKSLLHLTYDEIDKVFHKRYGKNSRWSDYAIRQVYARRAEDKTFETEVIEVARLAASKLVIKENKNEH